MGASVCAPEGRETTEQSNCSVHVCLVLLPFSLEQSYPILVLTNKREEKESLRNDHKSSIFQVLLLKDPELAS